MAGRIKFRGGTSEQHSTFTGATREITIDTSKNTVVVHDGSTPGGFPLAKESSVNTGLASKVDKNTDIVAGTNTKITYDSKGLVTGGSTPETLDGYGISDAYTKTESDLALDLKVGFDDLDSVNLFRADRYLASQIVSKMLYDVNKKLIKVRYNNNTDVDYEVLSYTDGNLTGVAHYIGGILKGNTVLQYVDGLFDSAPFTEV